MLDVLAEALIELFNPKQKQPPPRRRAPSAPPREDGWPEPSPDDPYLKDHDRDIPPARTVTLEDLVRKMAGLAAEPSPRPKQQTAPVKPTRVRSPKPANRSASRQTPQAVRKPAPPAAPVAVETPKPAQAQQKAAGADFAAKLRANPDAAREAFVFSEIFGRPLGERRGDPHDGGR